MDGLQFNPFLYCFLVYIMLAGPLTYFEMLFISKFLSRVRPVIESYWKDKMKDKMAAKTLIDQMVAEVWTLKPQEVLLIGWLQLPIATFLVILSVFWYVGCITDAFAPE